LTLGRLAEQSRQRREHIRSEVAERLSGFRARSMRLACRHAFKRTETAERAR
jgi:hypothetical protein